MRHKNVKTTALPNTDQSGTSFSDLSALGIEPAASLQIVSMITKFNTDFKRGVPQFVLEEWMIQDKLRVATQEKANLLVQTIFSVRTFLLTVMGFSLTAIGIVLSTLSSGKEILVYSNLLYLGMAFLGINVIGSVVYILYIHTLDSNLLLKQLNSDRTTGKNLQDLLQEYYLNSDLNFEQYSVKKKEILESKKEEEKRLRPEHKDWTPHVLGAFFLLGILSIVISFLLNSYIGL